MLILIADDEGSIRLFLNRVLRKQFSDNRLIEIIGHAQNMSLKEMINKTEKELRAWRGDDEFQDDVTLLAIQISNTDL